MRMIVIASSGDSLERIAEKHRSTVPRIMESNVICNPNRLGEGLPILVPDAGFGDAKSGGYPYYVMQAGDTLACIAEQFHQTEAGLAAANGLLPGQSVAEGRELLVAFSVPDAAALAAEWIAEAERFACELNPMQIHGNYYIGSFQWATLGEQAVAHLVPLAKHACQTVRYYAVMSLGRLASGSPAARTALVEAANDPDASVKQLAQLALRRTERTEAFGTRLHLTTGDQRLFAEPNGASASVPVRTGSEVESLHWNIPSSMNEEGPRGGLQYFDHVRLREGGQAGYLPRVGFGEIQLL